jgi:hypothetical protein
VIAEHAVRIGDLSMIDFPLEPANRFIKLSETSAFPAPARKTNDRWM